MNDASQSLAALVGEVAQDLTSKIPPSPSLEAPEGLGPWDAKARVAVQVLLLEVANALACCSQNLKGNEARSRRRLIRACSNPWAHWYLGALSSALTVEALHPEPPSCPDSLALANARLKRWLALPCS